jgi:hypothetical protein
MMREVQCDLQLREPLASLINSVILHLDNQIETASAKPPLPPLAKALLNPRSATQ